MKPITLYKKLFAKFGSQNWWPVTDSGQAKPTYKKRKKLSNQQRFEIMVGAILTQNTSWSNVMKAIEKLNKAKSLSIESIASMNEKKLAELIHSCIYFNQKAKYLKGFAKYLQKKYDGNLNKLFKKPVKELRKELLSLKGIGNETADSMLLYAGGKPVFMVDAYTKRIVNRLWKKEINNYVEVQGFFESQLKKDSALFNEFHALLVELAKQYCTKSKPFCSKCFLKKDCLFGLEN